MLKAYKYRLSPNNATTNKLQWVLDRCRELYNAALQERKEAYKYAGKTICVYEQSTIDLPHRIVYNKVISYKEVIHDGISQVDNGKS